MTIEDTMHYFTIYEEEFKREITNINHKLVNQSLHSTVERRKNFIMELETCLKEANITVSLITSFSD